MATLKGRVAVITGAGRGLGREYAMLFAREGASIVVNDLGAALDGSGCARSHAEDVAAEITASGGQAVANADDVSDWEGARRIVHTAIERFGDLHIVVNNAGNMRNGNLVDLTADDWLSVIRVHLTGHFAVTKFASEYWRAEAEAGRKSDRALINTASRAGCYPNAGKGNYVAAKAGISALTMVANEELAPYGVRCNAVAPGARTRMSLHLTGAMEASPDSFDPLDPANVAPFVAYLAQESCPIAGRQFFVVGNTIQLFNPWTIAHEITSDGRWGLEELAIEGPRLADFPLNVLKAPQ